MPVQLEIWLKDLGNIHPKTKGLASSVHRGKNSCAFRLCGVEKFVVKCQSPASLARVSRKPNRPSTKDTFHENKQRGGEGLPLSRQTKRNRNNRRGVLSRPRLCPRKTERKTGEYFLQTLRAKGKENGRVTVRHYPGASSCARVHCSRGA